MNAPNKLLQDQVTLLKARVDRLERELAEMRGRAGGWRQMVGLLADMPVEAAKAARHGRRYRKSTRTAKRAKR
jgi:hypothetical protein